MLKISIIIPIYRVEKYIGKCLDSIISQECKGIDIECILINDCTPDNSMEVISQKLKDYQGGINGSPAYLRGISYTKIMIFPF